MKMDTSKITPYSQVTSQEPLNSSKSPIWYMTLQHVPNCPLSAQKQFLSRSSAELSIAGGTTPTGIYKNNCQYKSLPFYCMNLIHTIVQPKWKQRKAKWSKANGSVSPMKPSILSTPTQPTLNLSPSQTKICSNTRFFLEKKHHLVLTSNIYYYFLYLLSIKESVGGRTFKGPLVPCILSY